MTPFSCTEAFLCHTSQHLSHKNCKRAVLSPKRNIPKMLYWPHKTKTDSLFGPSGSLAPKTPKHVLQHGCFCTKTLFLLRGHRHIKKNWCCEVAELIFACVSGRFQVLGEGLVANRGNKKGTLMFRNVFISVVSVLFF